MCFLKTKVKIPEKSDVLKMKSYFSCGDVFNYFIKVTGAFDF
jgi:hypothetical protein